MRQYGALVRKAVLDDGDADVLKLKARAIENRLSDADIEDSMQNTPDPREPCDNGTCDDCCQSCDGKGAWFEAGRWHTCLSCGGWG